jgi:predicted enzyme related to lactoylglutathione lyase
MEMPKVPPGSKQHPVTLVVISANDLAASRAFYAKLFGWQLEPMSSELIGGMAPAGPVIALRSKIPAGFPGIVPYIGVRDIDGILARVVAAGGAIERAAWSIPGVGMLARFKDPSGTIYGLTNAASPGPMPSMPMPFGPNPKPPAGALCSLEMYGNDGAKTARFFGDLFGWGTLETMPQYMAFDPGAGIGGVFQWHTPAMPAVAYLYATDVGAKLTEIEAAGGKRTSEAIRMPGFGCFGYFKDPSDTNLGLIGP